MEFIQLISDNWRAITSIASVGGTVVILWLSSKYVLRSECEKHQQEKRNVDAEQNKRHAETDRLHAALNARLENMPSLPVLNEIRIELTRLNGRIDALQEQIRGQQEILRIVKHQAERMNAFLLDHGGK